MLLLPMQLLRLICSFHNNCLLSNLQFLQSKMIPAAIPTGSSGVEFQKPYGHTISKETDKSDLFYYNGSRRGVKFFFQKTQIFSNPTGTKSFSTYFLCISHKPQRIFHRSLWKNSAFSGFFHNSLDFFNKFVLK